MKHTPEPWSAHKGGFYRSTQIPKPDILEFIGHCDQYDQPGANKLPDIDRDALCDRDYANADRIVSCVNACAGINPEAVPDLLDALIEMNRLFSLVWQAEEDVFGIENNNAMDAQSAAEIAIEKATKPK